MCRRALALAVFTAAFACQRVELSLEGRSCDGGGGCQEGYSCNERNVCVRDGSTDCMLGTDQHCAACGDDCSERPNVDAGTCDETRTCVVAVCDPGSLDENGSGEDGCEVQCDTCVPRLRDFDEDGFGTGLPQCACAEDPVFTAQVGGDCDDGDAYSFPGAPELCDGNRNDCDATVFPPAEVDADQDDAVACAPFEDLQGGQAHLIGGDCDDADPAIHPDALERCNGIADRCTASVPLDEVDNDGDGFVECAPWAGGGALVSGDCDDGSAEARPGGVESFALGGTCDDGLDNDCNGMVDDPAVCTTPEVLCPYPYRRVITVEAPAATPAGYSVMLVLDHQALVSAGHSRSDGRDVRVFYGGGGTLTELHRVLDPRSGWNRSDTRLWFELPQPLSGMSREYLLAYGASSPPAALEDERQVFHFADYFDREDNDSLGPGWTELESSGSDVQIYNAYLLFWTTNNLVNRPIARAQLQPLAGRLRWSFGFYWTQGSSPSDENYLVLMQAGHGFATPGTQNNDQPSHQGVGASFVWYGVRDGSIVYTEELGAYGPGSSFTYVGNYSGEHHFDVDMDLETQTSTLSVDDVERANDLPFPASISQVSELRFHTSGVTDDEFTTRRFTYTYVRPLVAPEPILSLLPVQSTTCP